MLLRVRVALPDRPGSLGQVARTLGVSGADIVQVVVLERLGGRAVDDFTVVWPGGSGVERLRAGLAAMPGVRVDGIWRAIGAPVAGGFDAELLAQVAAKPEDGLGTLVDAVPGLLAADWAAILEVPADWAVRRMEPSVVYGSWRMPKPPLLPEITPLRPRASTAMDGARFALVPFGRGGLVLAVARCGDDELPVAAFHGTEVDRLAQLVRATTVMLDARLDLATA
ncbi:MAG TPA: amino acid-binding protein [Micromonosporaceae bacterium]|nr:amino acid-binding protein [Micromonosporaceae bacterium]